MDVQIAIPGARDLPAALVLPASGRGPAAGVVVIHEILGLNRDIRRIADRFAAAGYVTLVPDFLSGLGPRPLCMARFMRSIAAGRDGTAFGRLEAARAWLAAREDVEGTRIGVAGFCIGGGFALLYAAGADVTTVAPFYPAVPDDPERALAGICPVVASFGGRDRMFGSGGARLDLALTSLGIEHDVRTYPEAGHSFMSRHGGALGWLGRRLPTRAAYHEPSAEDAWARTLAFFGRHLSPGS